MAASGANPAERIIARFGGQSALGALLGRRQSTVQHWANTGRIPAQWHRPLISLARQRGIILEAKDFVDAPAHDIAPAEGKLGVLIVGLGAVTSTFLAGVEHLRRGTIRLGKRTENRMPLIKDFVPLAKLDDLVFGAWDPIADNAYEAAVRCGVLDRYQHIEPIADFLRSIEPMPAAFEQRWASRIHGDNVKQGDSKMDLAEQIRQDIRDF